MRTAYDVLGVSRDASSAELKAARKRKAQQLHPDRNPKAAAEMTEINAAYAMLKDESRRAQYDAHGTTNFTSLQSQARDFILSMTSQSIDAVIDDQADLIALIREQACMQRQAVVRNITDAKRKIATARRRLTRIKSKGAMNLFAMLLSDLEAKEAQFQKSSAEKLSLFDEVNKMLDDYECSPPNGSTRTLMSGGLSITFGG